MMPPPEFFVPASATESLSALMFNGFFTIFLLPILLMDLLYFFPLALIHLLTGKARLRILPAALSGFALWLVGIAAALGVVWLVDQQALSLLYRTWSGLLGASIGVLHTLYCMIRYRKNMREQYYTHVLEKNLSRRQAEQYAALRIALQNGDLDAHELQNDRSMDRLARRIARNYLASRSEMEEWRDLQPEQDDIYFL